MPANKLRNRLAILDDMAKDCKVSEDLKMLFWNKYMLCREKKDREFYAKQYASRSTLHEVQVRSYELVSAAFFGY